MPVFRFRWIAAALAAGLVVGAGSLPAGAQGVVKNTFGDWQMRCEVPAGAKTE
jgi:invasion protein IalB